MQTAKNRVSYYSSITLSIVLFLLHIPEIATCIVINELMVNPSENGEWIELYNETNSEIRLADLWLIDAAGNRAQLLRVDLKPHQLLLLAPDRETLNDLVLPIGTVLMTSSEWPHLNNDGDILRLLGSRMGALDSVGYNSDPSRVKGRAWERIDPSLDGWNTNNWGPCADLRGHTAGRENSLRPFGDSKAATITVQPQLFNPNQGEVTRITAELPFNSGRLSMYVYDLNGRRRRVLASNVVAGHNSPSLDWNGRDDNGSLCPVGRYLIVVEAVDITGKESFTTRATVVVAGVLR